MLAMTACKGGGRTQELDGVRLPYGGRPMTAKVWEAVDKADEKQPIAESYRFIWPIPLEVVNRTTVVARTKDKSQNSRLIWNDLATPLLVTFLPLRIDYSRYVYDRAHEMPTGKQHLYWNLFWAGSSESGDIGSDLRMHAAGVPLFYGAMRVERIQAKQLLDFHQVLWTLGPAWMRFHGEGPGGAGHGYFVTPLLLGGALGTAVWTDYHIDAPEAKLEGHGPLAGFLGYWCLKAEKTRLNPEAAEHVGPPSPGEKAPDTMIAEGTRTKRLIIGGLLWHDFVDRDTKGVVQDSGHGPLWSAFGWGKKNGKFAVRVLFIPI